MEKLRKKMDTFLEVCVIVSASLMVLVVIIQVVSRFLLPKTPHWTEEASRIFFIFMVSFAGGLALKTKALINVDMVQNLFSKHIKQWLQLVIFLFIFAFMAIVLYESIFLIKIGALQTSPSLQISMSFLFLSMFLLSFFLCFYALLEVLNRIKTIRGK
jgi:TRAP-type C4-dicarboxylate transport system permease small subunit